MMALHIWSCFFMLLPLKNPITVEGARILGVFPIPARSHHVIHQYVLMTLADAGHQLVVYSVFPPKQQHANYTHVQLRCNVSSTKVDNIIYGYMNTPVWQCPIPFDFFGDSLIECVLGNQQLMKLIRSKAKFDLVITESFTSQEFNFILGHILNAPTVGIHTFITSPMVNNHLGNDLSLAFFPDERLPYSNKMSFVERTHSVLCILRQFYVYYLVYTPHFDKLLRTYFPEAPPLADLTKNVSLVFVNDHMLVDYARPRTPNMIPIAGIHIGPGGHLPQEIQDFMDDAPEGVILFSLGSLVPDDFISEAFFGACVKVFKTLPQKVLWKTRKDNLRELPKNVKALNWIPQQEVLPHQNCVLFVTHGGLLSQHETIHYGVPVVGIPQIFDQNRNVAFYVAQGVGVRLLPSEFSEETFRAAITTVIKDPRYKENMRRLSRVFRDRPMSPAESVVFWTEYVLRHRGAPQLTPESVNLPWYQLCLLDVAVVLLAGLFFSLVVIYYIVKTFLNKFRSKSGRDKNVRIKKVK